MVRKLKALYKAAVRSGKIVYLGPKHKFRQDEDFSLFQKPLAPIEWKQFEQRELLFRKHIASKKVNHGDFHCKCDIEQWFRLIKVLVGVFYKDGKFLRSKPSGQRWSGAFLKFCTRIANTFPRDNLNLNGEELNRIEYLEHQLFYIKNTIRPFFSLKRSTNNQDLKIPREKLTQLWLHRRKKAIYVIKNDGYWPSRDTFQLTTIQNEQYYDSLDKYVKAEDFVVNNDDYFDRSSVVVADEELFQHEEIETVVKSCPNGKTCGIDGVSYEDVKAVWDEHGDTLVDAFSISLKNLKLSDQWKHSAIQRIPKKNFDANDLSTLRDISLLPVSYKIFSKALCGRLLPYIATEVAFWQRVFLCKRDHQELVK